jgi:hypothetical protein
MHPFRTPLSHRKRQGMGKLDQETGGVGDWNGVNGLIGYSFFGFSFFNGGGTGNLEPGRPTSQQFSFMSPPNSGGPLVCVSGVNAEFVTDGGSDLTNRPLGAFLWNVWVSSSGVLECEIQLTDENSDDPIKVDVEGTLLFFGLGE